MGMVPQFKMKKDRMEAWISVTFCRGGELCCSVRITTMALASWHYAGCLDPVYIWSVTIVLCVCKDKLYCQNYCCHDSEWHNKMSQRSRHWTTWAEDDQS